MDIPATREELASLSLRQLSEKYHRHKDTVIRWRKALGIKGVQKGRSKVAIPLEELREDVPAYVIAKRYGCSDQTVWERRKDLGIVREHPGRPPRRMHRTAEERAVFGLLVHCYDEARKQGISWTEFLETFRCELPKLLERSEYDNEKIRVYGALREAS